MNTCIERFDLVKGKAMVLITQVGITASAAGVRGTEVLPYAGRCEGAYCGEFAVYAGYRDFCHECV